MAELTIGVSTSDLRREQLMLATVQAVAQWGYADTTVAKVARLANLTHGAVTYHFKSKDDMLRATFERMVEKTKSQYDTVVQASDLSPLDKIRRIIETETVAKFVDRSIWFQYWINMYAHPEFRVQVKKLDEYMRDAIDSLCVALNEERADLDLDPTTLAEGLTALLIGLWQTGQYGLSDGESTAPSPEKIGSQFLSWLLAGQSRDVNRSDLWQSSAILQSAGSRPEAERLVEQRMPAIAKRSLEGHRRFLVPVCSLPDAGRYLRVIEGHEDILLARSKDGSIRGYPNRCPKRGCRLTQDDTGILNKIAKGPCRGCVFDFDVDRKSEPKLINDGVLRLPQVHLIQEHGLLFSSSSDLAEGGSLTETRIVVPETARLTASTGTSKVEIWEIDNDWASVVCSFLSDDYDARNPTASDWLAKPGEVISLGLGSSLRRYGALEDGKPKKARPKDESPLSVLSLWPNVIVEFWPNDTVIWDVSAVDDLTSRLRHRVVASDSKPQSGSGRSSHQSGARAKLHRSRIELAHDVSASALSQFNAKIEAGKEQALFAFLSVLRGIH